MAYAPGPRRGGRSRNEGPRSRQPGGRAGAGRPSARGGYGNGRRASARGGGGPNPTALGIGIILLVGVIVVIIVVSSGPKERKEEFVPTELTGDSTVIDSGHEDDAYREKPPPPPPPLDEEIIQMARDLVAELLEDKAKGDVLYDEAMKAKDEGKDALWQTKLGEARVHFARIRDRWNEEVIGTIMGAIPDHEHWDAENVANHYLGKEGSKINKALKTLSYIAKQQRAK